MGHTVNFKTFKTCYRDKHCKQAPKEDWKIFENTHEAIIPRDFDISPDGSYMLVAHQSGDDAVLFKIDLENGALSEIQRIKVPTPICVKFYEV